MEDVGTSILITEYYPRISAHDAAQPVTRLTPHFYDIHIANFSATGAKQAGTIVGLPESPVRAVSLDNVHINAQKGITISDATVTGHNFTVKAAEGDPVTLLENAHLNRH